MPTECSILHYNDSFSYDQLSTLMYSLVSETTREFEHCIYMISIMILHVCNGFYEIPQVHYNYSAVTGHTRASNSSYSVVVVVVVVLNVFVHGSTC